MRMPNDRAFEKRRQTQYLDIQGNASVARFNLKFQVRRLPCWCTSPVNGATAFKRDQLTVTQGKDLIQKYTSSAGHDRCWCSKCGGHVFSDHPAFDLVDVYASVLEGLTFKPGAHVHYAQSILPIKDGLPKFKDFPKELGDSGEMMDE